MNYTGSTLEMLLKLAWRNLWRRKRRTLITSATVGFGMLFAVTFTGAGDYSYTNMIDTSAKMGLGHVTIEPAGYNDSPTLDKRFGGTAKILDSLAGAPGITASFARITGQAMFSTASKSIGGMFFAIDPKTESDKYNFILSTLTDGRLFDDPAGRGIVIGRRMAEKLNLDIGKKIIYTMADINGEIVSEMARVTGIFETSVEEIDGAFVILPIDRVRALISYAPDESSMVSVFLIDQRDAAKIAIAVSSAAKRPDLDVLPWKTTQVDLAGMISVDRAFNNMFQLLVGLMVSAGILNTVLMSVLERTREFGIMIAIGMAPRLLTKLVMTEAVMIGFVGLIMGVAISAPWYAYMYHVGIDLSSLFNLEGGAVANVPIDTYLRLKLYRESVFWIVLLLFLLTIAASIYPAVKAGKIPPVEAIKEI